MSAQNMGRQAFFMSKITKQNADEKLIKAIKSFDVKLAKQALNKGAIPNARTDGEFWYEPAIVHAIEYFSYHHDDEDPNSWTAQKEENFYSLMELLFSQPDVNPFLECLNERMH